MNTLTDDIIPIRNMATSLSIIMVYSLKPSSAFTKWVVSRFSIFFFIDEKVSHNSTTDNNKTYHPLEGVYTALSGPYEIRGEELYFVAIKDEFSRNIHNECVSLKAPANVFRVLDNIFRLVGGKVPQYEVSCILIDNSTEFHDKLQDNYLHKRMIHRDKNDQYQISSSIHRYY